MFKKSLMLMLLLSLSLALPVLAQPVAVHQWKLDDGAGTVAVDSIGGKNGTLVNMGGSPWVAGYQGGALDFPGDADPSSESYVSCGDLGDFSEGVSITAWIKADALHTNAAGIAISRHVLAGNLTATGLIIGSGSAEFFNGRVPNQLNMYWNGRWGDSKTSGIIVPTDEWVMVGMQASYFTGGLFMYVPSEDKLYQADYTDVFGDPTSLRNFFIGADHIEPPDGPIEADFRGMIDEVTVYQGMMVTASPERYRGMHVHQFKALGQGITILDDFDADYNAADVTASWSVSGGTLDVQKSNPVFYGLASAQFDYTFGDPNAPEVGLPIHADWSTDDTAVLSLHFHGHYNNPATGVYVTLQDGSGVKSTLVYPVAAVAQYSTWNSWKIPLTDFAGIDLSDVVKLAIGVGDDPDNPPASGSGQIWLDDIWVYPAGCLTPPTADVTGDCNVDMQDVGVMSGEWMQGKFPN